MLVLPDAWGSAGKEGVDFFQGFCVEGMAAGAAEFGEEGVDQISGGGGEELLGVGDAGGVDEGFEKLGSGSEFEFEARAVAEDRHF